MLNRSASLAMPTSILTAWPGKLDIDRCSPSTLYLQAMHVYQLSISWYFKLIEKAVNNINYPAIIVIRILSSKTCSFVPADLSKQ